MPTKNNEQRSHRVKNVLHNQALRQDIKKATVLLENTLQQITPVLAPSVRGWMRKLSGTMHPEDYFLHPDAFPMFLLPYWVEKATRARLSRRFHRDLIYSTLNGYYYVRLIDNFMDRDGDTNLLLLPAMHVFQFEYVRAYTTHFPPEHAFWRIMRETWFRSGDAAMHDAMLTDMDSTQFKNVAAQKVCAVKIPIAAVCHYYHRQDLIAGWNELVDMLGCWHQMLNDLFDWRKDLAHENDTYFLSEARRRLRWSEPTAEWVMREGFEWGIGLLGDWMESMQSIAAGLNSSGLRTYLRTRRALLDERVTELIGPVQAIQHLAAAIRSDR